MQMVLCDGKHFRAGAARAKRVALFFLDDSTRHGLHAVVGTSESTRFFLRGLYETIRRHGLMDVIFIDHGPGFISNDTAEVIARLDRLLIHGEVRYPEGHGKIERFNQTALHDLLRHLDRNSAVDPDCGALELLLQHYLTNTYNPRNNERLGTSPMERWEADERPLRFPESDAWLRDRFVVHVERVVSNDHVVSLDGVELEVPQGLARQRITLHRHLLDDTITIIHDDRLVELAPVDLVANANAQRARPAPADEPTACLPPSAALLASRRDLGPIVGPDGGFPEPTRED